MNLEHATLRGRIATGKSWGFQPTQSRAVPDSSKVPVGPMVVSGRAVTFGVPGQVSTGKGSTFRCLAPGSLVLAPGRDVIASLGETGSHALGRTRSGTLRIFQSTNGIDFELVLPNSTLGRDTFTSIRRGDTTFATIGADIHEIRTGPSGVQVVTRATLRNIILFAHGGKPVDFFGLVQVGKFNANAISKRMIQRMKAATLRWQIELLDQRLKSAKR